LKFLNRFSKSTEKIQKLIKIRPVGAELLHEDAMTNERTDRYDEANSRFHSFVNLYENENKYDRPVAKHIYV
jgi:hypothetical protein